MNEFASDRKENRVKNEQTRKEKKIVGKTFRNEFPVKSHLFPHLEEFDGKFIELSPMMFSISRILNKNTRC
jgi:hypothetical protein